MFRRACVNAQSLRHEGLYYFSSSSSSFSTRFFRSGGNVEKKIDIHTWRQGQQKNRARPTCVCACVLLEHIRLGKVLWRWFRESGVWRVCVYVCVWLAVCVRHDHPSHASGRPLWQRLNCVARFNNGSVVSPCCSFQNNITDSAYVFHVDRFSFPYCVTRSLPNLCLVFYLMN